MAVSPWAHYSPTSASWVYTSRVWGATKEVDPIERQHEFSTLIEHFTPGFENTQVGSPL